MMLCYTQCTAMARIGSLDPMPFCRIWRPARSRLRSTDTESCSIEHDHTAFIATQAKINASIAARDPFAATASELWSRRLLNRWWRHLVTLVVGVHSSMGWDRNSGPHSRSVDRPLESVSVCSPEGELRMLSLASKARRASDREQRLVT